MDKIYVITDQRNHPLSAIRCSAEKVASLLTTYEGMQAVPYVIDWGENGNGLSLDDLKSFVDREDLLTEAREEFIARSDGPALEVELHYETEVDTLVRELLPVPLKTLLGRAFLEFERLLEREAHMLAEAVETHIGEVNDDRDADIREYLEERDETLNRQFADSSDSSVLAEQDRVSQLLEALK